MNSQNMSEYSVDYDEQFVTKYLLSNPEFFGSNPDLLTQIKVPHRTGKAISLVERQLDVYRDKCLDLENRLNEVLVLATENEDLNQKLLALSNELTLCKNLKGIERVLQLSLRENFSTDKVAIHFLDKRKSSLLAKNSYATAELQQVLNKMPNELVMCPQLNPVQKQDLFVEPVIEIQSVALLSLGENNPYGLMVLGSNDINVFSPEKEVHALQKLRNILSAKLSTYCE